MRNAIFLKIQNIIIRKKKQLKLAKDRRLKQLKLAKDRRLKQLKLEKDRREKQLLPSQKYKTIYFNKIRNIAPPQIDIKWTLNPTTLTCCIVEPRIMQELRGVLYNIANIYGNTKDVGLVIFHGTKNESFVKNIVKEWKNVVLYNLNKENLKIREYSNLLTTRTFYDHFTSSHVLIFQSDSYIFHPISQIYYTFDYVGAPWCAKIGNGCGNGGISLRKVETMKKLTNQNGVNIPEDVYFSKQNMNLCTDDTSIHQQFSVEGRFHSSPNCCHKPYQSMNNNLQNTDYMTFLNKII